MHVGTNNKARERNRTRGLPYLLLVFTLCLLSENCFAKGEANEVALKRACLRKKRSTACLELVWKYSEEDDLVQSEKFSRLACDFGNKTGCQALHIVREQVRAYEEYQRANAAIDRAYAEKLAEIERQRQIEEENDREYERTQRLLNNLNSATNEIIRALTGSRY